VKLQTLNLGVKLFLTNPAQAKEIFKHVLELAKYDLNYDIRDKARLMRSILFAPAASPTLAQHAQRLFITAKPVPSSAGTEETKGSEYALGSLSHVVGHKALGYLVIPPTPQSPTPLFVSL
jgi:AP-3 complex subunit beta